MAKAIENPKKFIISCRVDDQEMRILQKRAQKAGLSITRLLRTCLELPQVDHRRQTADTENHACG